MAQYIEKDKVEEIDLEKEFYDFLDLLIGKDNGHLSEEELFRIAEYFFELGLRATQKEEGLKEEHHTPTKPKNILKRIFCKHIYKYSHTGIINRTEPDFSGDGCYNSWQEHYTEYICTKCGNRKRVFK